MFIFYCDIGFFLVCKFVCVKFILCNGKDFILDFLVGDFGIG